MNDQRHQLLDEKEGVEMRERPPSRRVVDNNDESK